MSPIQPGGDESSVGSDIDIKRNRGTVADVRLGGWEAVRVVKQDGNVSN